MEMGLTIDDFIAGWIGGVCGLIVGHPLDTVKVRQQTFGGTNMFTVIRKTFKYEGVTGFYKGLLFPLLTVGPSNAIFFGVYGNVMNLMEKTQKRQHSISYSDPLTIKRVFIAGSVAGFFQVLFTCPVELVKTVLQAKTEGKGPWRAHYEVPYSGSFSAFKGILRDQGVKGLFRGITPMMWRDVPTSGLFTLTYELLLYSNFSKCESPVVLKQTIAGGAAGVASWILVIPMDVAKSRMQADRPDNPAYRGTMDCIYKIYKTEGVRVLFRGLPAIIVRAFPSNAMLFVGYEAALEIGEAMRS